MTQSCCHSRITKIWGFKESYSRTRSIQNFKQMGPEKNLLWLFIVKRQEKETILKAARSKKKISKSHTKAGPSELWPLSSDAKSPKGRIVNNSQPWVLYPPKLPLKIIDKGDISRRTQTKAADDPQVSNAAEVSSMEKYMNKGEPRKTQSGWLRKPANFSNTLGRKKVTNDT